MTDELVSLQRAIYERDYLEYKSQGCTPTPKDFIPATAIVDTGGELLRVTFDEGWRAYLNPTGNRTLVLLCP
jgi:hypothetical protein